MCLHGGHADVAHNHIASIMGLKTHSNKRLKGKGKLMYQLIRYIFFHKIVHSQRPSPDGVQNELFMLPATGTYAM